jgi:hypothetical protein
MELRAAATGWSNVISASLIVFITTMQNANFNPADKNGRMIKISPRERDFSAVIAVN